jgi:hypothetical protein
MNDPLMIKCLYRTDGIQCGDGILFDSVTFTPMLLEGASIPCPACEGKGVLLTSKGRELLAFLEKFPVNNE